MSRSFELSEAQEKKFEEWVKDKKVTNVGPIGGAYTFCFTRTGLGTFVIVKCVDGTELDLTDYKDI